MKTILCTLLLLASQTTFAATSPTVWEGQGTLTTVHGQQLSTYKLLVERTEDKSGGVTNVTVTLPDGSTQNHVCRTTDGSHGGWKSVCDHGTGGGRCLTEGLCISYEEEAGGKAFATSIVMDGPADMRLLRTELQDGKAVQFFSEKLHKR
jgi:hypothetical protein